MTSLTELERSLAPDLRRAFDEVMPRLEESLAARLGQAVDPSGGDVVALVRADDRADRRRLHRLAGSAAAVAVLVGATWWVGSGARTPSAPAVSAPVASTPVVSVPTDGPATPTTVSTTVPAPVPNESGRLPLDGLDPLTAARRVSIGAVIDPTPEEEADLTIAGAILRRSCMREGGAAVDELTSADHAAARDAANAWLRTVSQFSTTDGLEWVRDHGYGLPDIADPVWIDVEEGSFEAQLLIDGCAEVDSHLKQGPAETELELLTEYPAEWGYERTRTDRDPVYAARYAAYTACMEDVGLRAFEYGADADENPFGAFLGSEPPTAEELTYAGADVDCRLTVGLQEAYVDAIVPIVEQFVVEEADALAAVHAEREIRLAAAREVLRAHGIEPFTNDPAA